MYSESDNDDRTGERKNRMNDNDGHDLVWRACKYNNTWKTRYKPIHFVLIITMPPQKTIDPFK